MDKELEAYFIRKYPLIFKEMYGDPKDTCMAWGISCGKGWTSLLDGLCHQIQCHINNHNEGIKQGYPYYKDKKEIPQVVALQIKEKFAGLRFYYEGGDEQVEGMVRLAEELSYSICEECGNMNMESVSQTPINQGWMRTYCERCVPVERKEGWLENLYKKKSI